MRADKYFADKFDSRTKAAEAIEKGLVLVNGKTIKPKDEIRENDVITFIEEKTVVPCRWGDRIFCSCVPLLKKANACDIISQTEILKRRYHNVRQNQTS